MLKWGSDITFHKVDIYRSNIRSKFHSNTSIDGEISYDWDTEKITFLNYEPELVPDTVLGIENYSHSPIDVSAYIQDKMEFEEMVINLGLRLDYYDPSTVIPSNLRNPGNQLYFEDQRKMSTYVDADVHYQLSPRLGLSYQLGEAALLRFSYGHFFQRPSFGVFYSNSNFLISSRDFSSTMGNPNLKPEKTVSYEVGLWQQIAEGMGFEVAVYYKDIYNLLTIIPITTYNQIRYGLYSNKDYGNTKGMELKWDFKMDKIQAFLNYTLQYTKGVADEPRTNFNRAGSKLDQISILIPMRWDQRHTFNLTFSYTDSDYGASVTAFYNSGFPYTWAPQPESRISDIRLYPNNAPRPSMFQVDLKAFYDIWQFNNYRLRANLLVFNLLDELNEINVHSSTGRAGTAVIREADRNDHHSDFNTYEDRILNPEWFSPPRLVKLGLELEF